MDTAPTEQWFVAVLVFESRIVEDPADDASVDVQYRLVRAVDAETAYERALAIGKREQHSYKNCDGNTCEWFFAGLGILALDVIVTIVDAYIEKDSRAFMGGLPRWEYVIHLLVNGFHFASIAVFLVIKIRMTATGITLVNQFDHTRAYTVFIELVKYLIPGAIAIALLHIAVSIPFTAYYWNAFRARLSK